MKPKTKKFIKWALIIIVVIIGYARWSSLSLEQKVNELIWDVMVIGFFGWLILRETSEEHHRKEIEDSYLRDGVEKLKKEVRELSAQFYSLKEEVYKSWEDS